MKIIKSFALLILISSLTLAGMTSNVFAQDDPRILLKIAIQAQEQIGAQISIESSDKVQKLYHEGIEKVNALKESIVEDDITSAKEYFLSAMKLFKETSSELTFQNVYQNQMNSSPDENKDPSSDLERLHVYVNNMKTIAKNHNATHDFSQSDEMFKLAKQQIANQQFAEASATTQKIKENIMELNKELRQEASKQEHQRAKQYAQKYLVEVDRLIEIAKQQNIATEIIEHLENSKENLSIANDSDKIIEEIRKILLIKEKFELQNNELQIKKSKG